MLYRRVVLGIFRKFKSSAFFQSRFKDPLVFESSSGLVQHMPDLTISQLDYTVVNITSYDCRLYNFSVIITAPQIEGGAG